MKICNKTGCGVCLCCDKKRTLADSKCDICINDAEAALDMLAVLKETTLTDEQTEIIKLWEE